MKTNILIVDDHNIFREGLKLVIKSSQKYKVVSEVSTSEELFNLPDIVVPDVIVLNLVSRKNSQTDILKQISKKFPHIPVVILTFEIPEKPVLEFVEKGCHGLLWKGSEPKHLIEAIEKVKGGEQYIDLPENLLSAKIIKHSYEEHSDVHDFSVLTDREKEVFRLFVNGHSYKSIGEHLFISPRTVETHKNNILSKLELNSMNEMIKFAIRHDLIDI